jgi:inorganic pyrophosphatase
VKQNSPEALPAFDKDVLNAVVETPKGSRNKFKWDTRHELYKLSNVLPNGSYFPYDFGFVPSTEAEDGDPIDVLLFMDEPAFPGCLVPARLLGVILAKQDDGKRNDRLIAVAGACEVHKDVCSLDDLSKDMLHELEHFFTSYHEARGEEFKVLGRKGPKHAVCLVKEAEERFREKHRKRTEKGRK